MAESADTDDTNAVGGFGGERVEDIKDSCTTAHERSGVFGAHVLGDFVDVVCLPDCVGSERSLVKTGR